MTDITYMHRLHAFKPTTTWVVKADGLHWTDDKGGAGHIPYGKIKSVRMRFEPSRAEIRRVALHVYTPIQHTITNIHYQGPLDFTAQGEEFACFVTAFHAKFPPDTETVFHRGSTRGAYIGNVLTILAIFALLFLLAPLLSMTGIPSAGSVVRIGIIIIFIPVLLSLLIKNRPSTYRPGEPPLDMLR